MKTFKHSGNTGDILYSLYAIEACGEMATIYLDLNQRADYAGRVHPLGNVMLNEKMYDMLKPLLLSFPFIETVEKYEGQPIDYDLDKFRQENLLLDRGNIIRWYFQVYPELTNDISKPLLYFAKKHNDTIIVNRTERYRNADVRYKVLNEIDNPIMFLGLPHEYDQFKLRVPKAEYHEVKSFLEAMWLINECKLFIGNQSMMFAIAEILKAPRALELYKHCPNVIPCGGIAYDFINEDNLRTILKLQGII